MTLNKTHPVIHICYGAWIAGALIDNNFMAAAGAGGGWVLLLGYDFYVNQVKERMKTLELFAKAHNCEWPSEEAKKAAAVEMEAWRKS